MSNEKNYSFYMFKCNNSDIINTYVGSTQNFRIRKSAHKSVCNNKNNKGYELQIYQIIRQNGGWSNWNMVQIHEQMCKSRTHSKQIEQEFMDKYKSEMNIIRAIVTKEQKLEEAHNYYIENIDRIHERDQKYRAENIDKGREQNRNYRAEHSEEERERHRKYRAEHLDEERERYRKYYIEHIDEIRERRRKRKLELKQKKI